MRQGWSFFGEGGDRTREPIGRMFFVRETSFLPKQRSKGESLPSSLLHLFRKRKDFLAKRFFGERKGLTRRQRMNVVHFHFFICKTEDIHTSISVCIANDITSTLPKTPFLILSLVLYRSTFVSCASISLERKYPKRIPHTSSSKDRDIQSSFRQKFLSFQFLAN
jgi:hypothetical protein